MTIASVESNADELARRCVPPLLAVVEHGGGFDRDVDWLELCATACGTLNESSRTQSALLARNACETLGRQAVPRPVGSALSTRREQWHTTRCTYAVAIASAYERRFSAIDVSIASVIVVAPAAVAVRLR